MITLVYCDKFCFSNCAYVSIWKLFFSWVDCETHENCMFFLLSISSEEQRVAGPKVTAGAAGKGTCQSVNRFISPTASATPSFTNLCLSSSSPFVFSCWFVLFLFVHYEVYKGRSISYMTNSYWTSVVCTWLVVWHFGLDQCSCSVWVMVCSKPSRYITTSHQMNSAWSSLHCRAFHIVVIKMFGLLWDRFIFCVCRLLNYIDTQQYQL